MHAKNFVETSFHCIVCTEFESRTVRLEWNKLLCFSDLPFTVLICWFSKGSLCGLLQLMASHNTLFDLWYEKLATKLASCTFRVRVSQRPCGLTWTMKSIDEKMEIESMVDRRSIWLNESPTRSGCPQPTAHWLQVYRKFHMVCLPFVFGRKNWSSALKVIS